MLVAGPMSPTDGGVEFMDRIDDDTFNAMMAARFREAAEVLEAQHAANYRIDAYRHGADTLERLLVPASTIYRRDGLAGLISLPSIGEVMARAIANVVNTGTWTWLDRLEHDGGAETLLATLPEIGPQLAARLHVELGIESLDELERAFYDGRLGRLRGFGDKRMHAIRDALAQRRRTNELHTRGSA
jgi:DNA polymerase/3'-5' exonuclease PolX